MVQINAGDAAFEKAPVSQPSTQPTRAMPEAPPPHLLTEAALGRPESGAKPKRARISKPKVKTGCHNCKRRRIKCDEARPVCSQCVRSKKTCTGYPPPSRSAGPFPVLIAPKPVGAAGGSSSLTTTTTTIPTIPTTNAINNNSLGLLLSHPQIRYPTGRAPLQVPPRRLAKYLRRAITLPDTPTPRYATPVTRVPAQQHVAFYRTPSGLSLNQREAQYFQLFREHTTSDLSGFFDSAFWSRTVLQECHSDQAIRHAVIALGALYKTLDKSAESPPPMPHVNADNGPFQHVLADHPHVHWEMAVRQYSHALNSLVVVSSADRRSHRARLMASVLLACFDSFVGDHKQAIKQIQNGLGLLDRLRNDPAADEPIDSELLHMFTRLAIQAKSYDMAFHFPHPYVVMLSAASTATPPGSRPASASPDTAQLEDMPSGFFATPVDPESYFLRQHIPDRFSTVVEARLACDCLIKRVLHFNEIMLTRSRSGVMGIMPEIVARQTMYGLQFRVDFERWAAAFDPILSQRTAPDVSSLEKAGIAVLKMYNTMGYILFTMGFSNSEAQFDRFTPEFRNIIELALEVVGDEERRAAAAKRCQKPRFYDHHEHPQPSFAHSLHHSSPVDFDGAREGYYETCHLKPSFSADLGIVPPLFVTATKCRDPLIRRQAIQLLRSSSRREAMWDSEMTARIAKWVLDVEEEGLHIQPPVPPPPPPQHHQPPRHDDMDLPPSPAQSTVASPPSDSTTISKTGSLDYGDTSLVPGGNPRWLPSVSSATARGANSGDSRILVHGPGSFSSPHQPSAALAHGPTSIINSPPSSSELVIISSIHEARRVMVRSVDFDLRARFAVVKVGSRELPTGSLDTKTRVTKITW